MTFQPQAALDHLAKAPDGQGAGRLRAMLGAKIIVGDASVVIRFRGSRKYNMAEITVQDSDLYRLRVGNLHRGGWQTIEGLYADQLAGKFREVTGLDTYL